MNLLAAPTARNVEKFELTTRDGRTYTYPQPSWLGRLAAQLHSIGEPALISAAVLGTIYFAGLLAKTIEPAAFDACGSADKISFGPLL